MIFLDIETLQQDPYPWMTRSRAELRPPKNYKDPEKIAAWLDDAEAEQTSEQREKSSLEPLLGGIIACVGAAVGWAAAPGVLVNATGDEAGERKILASLQRRICAEPAAGQEDARRLPIVSWNGSFDWAYIAKRAIRHGLHPLAGRMLPPKPWGSRSHIDAAEPWCRLDRQSLRRQKDVARYLGIEVADDVDGGQVSALWATDRARVVEHCRSDVHVLREITRHELAAGWLPADEPEGAAEVVIPPPRGSAEDLLARAHRLQITTDPDRVTQAMRQVGAWTAEEPPTTEHLGASLAMLPSLSTDILRAYLVALGGRP